MGNITIDMSPLVHGSRAVSQCTASIVSELIEIEGMEFNLIYFGYQKKYEKRLSLRESRFKEKVIPIPYRFLIPAWKIFSRPTIEMMVPECNLLYTNEFYFPPAKDATILATVHGLAYRIIPEKIFPHIVRFLDKGLSYLLKHADYLIAVSETTRRELIDQVGVSPERIYVVTHGVDSRFKQPKNRQDVLNRVKNVFGLKRPYILYVGAIGLHKNIMGILAAYEMISAKTSHELVLAGPPDSAWDEAHSFVADHNLSERVHFLGYIDPYGNNLPDLYNGADLFVFPSFYEGWTSPPLEAMACGTPVITSNCSSLPETVGDAAVKIDPDNPEALADEMRRVLSSKALQSDLIEKGLRYSAFHTWKNSAEKLARVFEDIESRGPWKGKR